MGLFTFVMAAPNGDGTVHIQAVGPGFPKGYTSGEVTDETDSVKDCTLYVPSMRGSGRLYTPVIIDEDDGEVLTPEGDLVCYVADLVRELGAPQPPYHAGDEVGVSDRVTRAMDVAVKGTPKPSTASKLTAEQVSKAVNDAVQAALRALGLN
jgi:hypothetical protein